MTFLCHDILLTNKAQIQNKIRRVFEAQLRALSSVFNVKQNVQREPLSRVEKPCLTLALTGSVMSVSCIVHIACVMLYCMLLVYTVYKWCNIQCVVLHQAVLVSTLLL